MIIMLWRKNHVVKKIPIHENKLLLSVMANRRTGKNGNVGLIFNDKNGCYDENHSWVESMEKQAEQELGAENDFNQLF